MSITGDDLTKAVTARRKAESTANILARSEPTTCHAHFTECSPVLKNSCNHRHAVIVARFEELLTIKNDRPLYLAEICTAIGVSERTLRVCCHEHLGIGPMRYLWLRRMHLARRALIMAKPEATTVTKIAMDYGFWELGRFSVNYGALFGEAPSASLRKKPDDRRMSRGPSPESA